MKSKKKRRLFIFFGILLYILFRIFLDRAAQPQTIIEHGNNAGTFFDEGGEILEVKN